MTNGLDDALKAELECCSAIQPPTYVELDTETHLNTFDISSNGVAVFLNEHGRLFLLNLYQSTSSLIHLMHLDLDPRLTAVEVRSIECVSLNNLATSVLLTARTWVKVIHLPSNVINVLHHQTSTRMSDFDAKRVIYSVKGSKSTRDSFLVIFQDGSTETVQIGSDANSTTITRANVEQEVLRKKRQGVIATISRQVPCASVQAVGYYRQITQAMWHPLSDFHVVVLSKSEEIAIFNVKEDVSNPEQHHLLDFSLPGATRSKPCPSAASTSAFSFPSSPLLSSQASSWEVFTCYLLRTDGSIYALCPFVPYGICVHESVLVTLKNEVESRLEQCREQSTQDELSIMVYGVNDSNKSSRVPSSIVAQLKSQKYWLQEMWTSVKDHANDVVYQSRKPHESGISPNTWPLEVQGPVETTPTSTLEKKHHIAGGCSAASLLVLSYTLPTKSDTVMGVNPLLVRSFTSGHVELVLLDEPVRPQWKDDKRRVSSTLSGLLLESLNLGFDDSGGRADLVQDREDERLVYCLHSSGVQVINVGWVLALIAGSTFTALPQSSVREIFTVSPLSSASNTASIIGARVIKNVYVGHLLLLRLASGGFEILSVSAASSELIKGVHGSSHQTPSVSPASTTPDWNLQPFGEIVDNEWNKRGAGKMHVTGSTRMDEIDEAGVAFVIERIRILQEDVQYCDVLDQLMKDRIRVLCATLQKQAEKATTIESSLQSTKDGLLVLQKKIKTAMLANENFRKRAAALVQATKENQPVLSRAEREFKEELAQVAIDVRRMKPRATQLSVASQRVVRNLEHVALSKQQSSRRFAPPSSNVLSTEKQKMCYDVLRAESQLIDETKTMLEAMKTSFDRI